MEQERNKILALRSSVGNALSFVRGAAARDKIISTTFNDMINEAILAIDNEDNDPPGRLQQLDVLEEQMGQVADAIATMNLDLDISEFDDTFPEEEFVSEDDELGDEVW